MADYSTAASNAQTALNSSTDGEFVEEYENGRGKIRVKRGTPLEQVKATAMLNGLNARRLRLAKFQRPEK